ncbi:MAG: hypothetical protein AAFQ98_16780 [Bacteroidota bacterium]
MIEELKPRMELDKEDRINRHVFRFQDLLSMLRERDLPEPLVAFINERIQLLNAVDESHKILGVKVRKAQSQILSRVEKVAKIVPKNYYRNMWLALGMSTFGIPLGVAFGVSLDNMAFLGIGLPFGIAIGIGVGTNLDKKAANEGRQLDFEVGT